MLLETLPSGRAGEFYDEATRGRSGSHRLQVKAALALLYHVLGSTNPFADCPAPKFALEKTELRYHTASQLGQLLHELREDRRTYFGHLTYHLATALFFTGCRFHEWARLTPDRLVRELDGVIIAARLQVKGGCFRDLPVTKELSASLEKWFAFLESVKGVWLRSWGVDFAGSPLIFPGRDGAPFSNQASTPGSSSLASERECLSFPPISFGIRPRRCYLTSVAPTCVTCRRFLGIRAWQRRPAIHTSIPSGFAH